LRRALAIREAVLPDDDPDLAGSREALALFLQKEIHGLRDAESRELCRRHGL
jgi:hypothetical protein